MPWYSCHIVVHLQHSSLSEYCKFNLSTKWYWVRPLSECFCSLKRTDLLNFLNLALESSHCCFSVRYFLILSVSKHTLISTSRFMWHIQLHNWWQRHHGTTTSSVMEKVPLLKISGEILGLALQSHWQCSMQTVTFAQYSFGNFTQTAKLTLCYQFKICYHLCSWYWVSWSLTASVNDSA
jgi:hypothetical protein